jgi:ATP-grasp domain
MRPPPRLLFLSLADDPGSDRIVAAMGRHGARCGVIGSAAAFAMRSRFAADRFPLPRLANYLPESLFLAPRLRGIVRDWRPDLIVPLDDRAARVLRDTRFGRKAGPEFQALVERSLGAPAKFAAACSREKLTELAQRLGIRTPRQEAATSLQAAIRAAEGLGYPAVLKREQTCGGVGVAIVKDEAELRRAFRRTSIRAAVKRCLSFMPGFRLAETAPLTLQRYVTGALTFRALACAQGVVLDGVSFMAERRNPSETGASTVLRAIANEEMAEASRRIVAALGCSGFVAFDFILSEGGEASLIEMNARPIASGHLGRFFGHDIYAAMFAHLTGTAYLLQDAIDPPRSVALFPRELDRDPTGALLDCADAVLHDIPHDDPPIVEACVAWLETRHPRERAAIRLRLQAAPSAPLTDRIAAGRAEDATLQTGETAPAKG